MAVILTFRYVYRFRLFISTLEARRATEPNGRLAKNENSKMKICFGGYLQCSRGSKIIQTSPCKPMILRIFGVSSCSTDMIIIVRQNYEQQ